jgi:biopolymer transport protein ExbD
MNSWKFRNKHQSDQVQQVDASMLLAMIQNKMVDDRYEYLPPRGLEWVSLNEVVRLLDHAPAQADAQLKSPKQHSEIPKKSQQALRRETAVTAEASSGIPVVGTFGRLGGSARRGKQFPIDDEIDMTPMIDMTFLLLIFFMVASSVGPAWRQISLPPATSGDTQDPENRVVVVLDFASPLDEGKQDAMTGSRFTTLADARIQFADVKGGLGGGTQQLVSPDTLGQRLKQAFQEKPAAQFILLSHRKMPVGVVREVPKQSKAAGAKETLVGVSVPH